MPNYYEAMDFDRNILPLVGKLRFVDLDCYNMIEVMVVAEPNAVKPFAEVVGKDLFAAVI